MRTYKSFFKKGNGIRLKAVNEFEVKELSERLMKSKRVGMRGDRQWVEIQDLQSFERATSTQCNIGLSMLESA